MQLDYLLFGLANITFVTVLFWKCYSGDINASVASVSGLAAAIVLNGALFMGIGIRVKREGKKLSRHIMAFGLLLGMASAGGTALAVHFIPAQDDFTHLAYSNQPLEEIHPEQKRLFVKLLRRRERLSTDYTRLAATVKPISPPLYSPESFATPAAIQNTSGALKLATETDFAYFDRRQQATNEFRDQMERIDPSSEYLLAWMGASKREESLAALEHAWVSSVTTLYDYAGRHSNNVRLINGQLLFSNDGERAEFVKQLDMSKALYATFQSDMQKSQADQKPELQQE